jgi:hypothetical protein
MYQQSGEQLSVLSGKEAIRDVLSRAAVDQKFLARLAENPHKVLTEYNLTLEERTALARGDIARIESWLGQLDEPLRTWFTVRMTRERW